MSSRGREMEIEPGVVKNKDLNAAERMAALPATVAGRGIRRAWSFFSGGSFASAGAGPVNL
jgi:hypothetical protein